MAIRDQGLLERPIADGTTKVQNSSERSKSGEGAERERSCDVLKAKSRIFAAFCIILL